MALSNKRLILAKLELTYGTDSVPTPAANAILCGSLNITPLAGDVVQRNIIKPHIGSNQSFQVTAYATVDFEVELSGGGIISGSYVKVPQYGCLLKACGFSESALAGTIGTTATGVVYSPITLDNFTQTNTAISIYFYLDGVKHTLVGARGSVSFDLTVKQLPKMKFTFTGILGTTPWEDNTNIPTGAVYTGAVNPVAVTKTNTTGISLPFTTTDIIESFTLDIGNDVKFRTLVGTGAESVIITDRKAKGTVKVQANNADFVALLTASKANTLGTFSITHGTVVGNKVKFDSATGGVAINSPKYSSSDGVDMLDLNMDFIPTSVGNDEIKITVQ